MYFLGFALCHVYSYAANCDKLCEGTSEAKLSQESIKDTKLITSNFFCDINSMARSTADILKSDCTVIARFFLE